MMSSSLIMINSPDPSVGEGKDAGLSLLGGAQLGPPVHNLGADFKTLESFKNEEEKKQSHCHASSCLRRHRETEITEGKYWFNC